MRRALIPLALLAVVAGSAALLAAPKNVSADKEKSPAAPPPADLAPAPAGRFVDNGDGTVTDTVRRLMWTKADGGKEMTWPEARAWCRSLAVAGHADWRMPTAEELGRKLYDGLQPEGKWIPDRRVAPFAWSGDTYWSCTSGDAGHHYPGMFTRDFRQSYSGPGRRNDKAHIRACRSLPRPEGPRFHDNGDGTVTDRWEGLTWAKADGGDPLTLKEAWDYCLKLELAGRRGWRVPTIEELHDALYVGIEDAKPGVGLNRMIAPFEWSGDAYWTNDPIVPEGWPKGHDVVRFFDGSHGWVNIDDLRFVRACRDGQ